MFSLCTWSNQVHQIRKGCFFFGRNSDQVDYVLNHASCSRVHAVLLFNPIIERFFLNDFGSGKFSFSTFFLFSVIFQEYLFLIISTANGSFVDKSKKPLEANHLVHIPFELNFSFGASTRLFRIVNRSGVSDNTSTVSDATASGSSLSMAQSNDEKIFDEETQRNTILNQAIRVKDTTTSDNDSKHKNDNSNILLPAHGNSKSVRFSETVDFINLHETDDNVGQFGDLAKTNFNPNKRKIADTQNDYPNKTPFEVYHNSDDEEE